MAVIITVQDARFLRAQSQTFNIIPTPKPHIIIVFGSTGNAYGICIKRTSLTCTCPDRASGCKHILFLLSALGYLKNHQSHVTINTLSVLQKLLQSSAALQASCLDKPTCVQHTIMHHASFVPRNTPVLSSFVLSVVTWLIGIVILIMLLLT